MTHPYEETLTTAVAEAPEGQPLPTESAAASSRAHAPLLTALFASTALAACGGGGGDSTPGAGAPGTPGTTGQANLIADARQPDPRAGGKHRPLS